MKGERVPGNPILDSIRSTIPVFVDACDFGASWAASPKTSVGKQAAKSDTLSTAT
jgi:hypothetical protein